MIVRAHKLLKISGIAFLLAVSCAALTFIIPTDAQADWTPLVERLIRDGKNEKAVRQFFVHPEARFDPDPMSMKITSLVRALTRAPSPESNERLLAAYRGFLKPDVIDDASAYLHENRATLQKVRTKYCVPEEVVVAIMLVETRLGRNTGSRRAFNTLASMALMREIEMVRPYLAGDLVTSENEGYARRRLREKSDWAYQELKSLIHYSEKNQLDPLKIPGSVYGAIGLCQFMPSNIFPYGVDADGDGRIDLFTTEDALHSIGKYLQSHGWKCQMDRKGRHRVVMTYNRSRIYADTVLDVAEKLRQKMREEKLQAAEADRS